MSTSKTYTVICDIETRGDPARALANFDPDSVAVGNLKDPVKIAEKIAKARLACTDKAALSPWTGACCSIGYLSGREPVRLVHAYDEDEERRMLEEWFTLMAKGRVIVGYNFAAFDLPFLITRARLLGLPILPNVAKSIGSTVLDAFREVTCWVHQAQRAQIFPNSKLELVAKRFGVGETSLRSASCEGKDYWANLSSGDAVKIARAENHLTSDLLETQAIARKIGLLS